MQIPLVMMLALSGLGCQNGASAVIDTPPLPGHQIDAQPFTSSQGTAGGGPCRIPALSLRRHIQKSAHVFMTATLRSEPTDWHTGLRYTLYSFVWGHDPNVSTAREIEASVYGFQSDH